MDNTLQNYRSSSFMAELAGWNQQEQKFRELFSDQALQDREFLKMKLSEYNRIWYKHRGTAQTTDEKALLIMLRFHRRKLQKAIYPGLLTRLVSRAYAFTKDVVRQWIEGQSLRRVEGYNLNPIPVPKQIVSVEKSRVGETDVRQHHNYAPRQKQRQRKNHRRIKQRGRSI